jgi:hypothetical protein
MTRLAENVKYYQLSPDESRVVYYSAIESAYFSIPSSGGDPIQLAELTTFDANIDLSRIFFSSNSQRVLLVVDGILRSIALDGSNQIELADKVADFVFMPLVNRVVYTVDVQITFDTVKVYSRNIDGATPAVVLNPTGTSVTHFAVTDDGETVVIVTNAQGSFGLDRPYKLQAVPIGGGDVTDLLTIADDQFFDAMTFSPESTRVLLTTTDSFDPFAATKRVFSLPLDGSAGTTLFEGQAGQQITTQISADSTRLLTMIGNPTYGYTLTKVLLTGGSAATVATLPDGSYETPTFAITPDSSAVVFRTPDGVASASLTGTVTTTLASGLEGYEGELTISADSARVFFTGVSTVEGQRARRLYAAPLDGSGATVISGPLIERGNVTDFLVHPNGHAAVYRADADKDEVYELYSTDGLSATLRLTTQNATVIEGSGTTTITVGLSAPQLTETEVEYTLSGTATEGDDYTIAAAPAAALTFAPGETSKSLLVTILDDNVDEVAETIIITFALPNGASQSVTLTIPANDTVIVDPEVRLYLPIVRR